MLSENKFEIPTGLGMALAQNSEAMQNFAVMTNEKKQAVIDATHSISSKKEMRALVERIGKGDFMG